MFLYFRHSVTTEQENILQLFWKLWPLLPNYGRKSSQFVDLLGYFSVQVIKSSTTSSEQVMKLFFLLLSFAHLLTFMIFFKISLFLD